MNIAYLDLPSGLSGDMFLGCLVDCGWPIERLRNVVERLKLPADEWSISATDVKKKSIRAKSVQVTAKEGHVHRHLKHIDQIINGADLPDAVKQRAIAIFTRLAHAEAKVHGTTPEKVHFHEVGAVDAIIDIVGAAAGIHDLAIEKIYASAVPLSPGWGQMAHGQMPLPAPATLELLSACNAPTRPGPAPGEWVTPTGAAILAESATFEQPEMRLIKIGLGAGQKDCDWPNIARLWLGEPLSRGALVQIETNIDDMNPQLYAAATEKLFAAGALDVWLIPIQMKKNRPGILFSILARAADEPQLARILLQETTTFGVRVTPVHHRHEAKRESHTIQTEHGQLQAKLKWLDSELLSITPEYEDCKTLAQSTNQPLLAIWQSALAECQKTLAEMRTAAPRD